MEEDIRKCEEFINLSFLYGKLSFTKTQLYEYQTAIKNLLTRYKQLEEENKNMREEYLVNNPGMAKYLKDNYIFKSKAIEKIEELDKEKLKYDNDLRIYTLRNTFDFQKEVLQELLREE